MNARDPRTPARAASPRRDGAAVAARALGWFSIGLGLAELLAPRLMARGTGQRGREGTLRVYGVREVATGIGLLATEKHPPWLWARVAGDVLDAVTLATAARPGAGGRRARWALAAVAGVTALDVAAAVAARRAAAGPARPARDYSDRSGFPGPADTMRGRARTAFYANGAGPAHGATPADGAAPEDRLPAWRAEMRPK